MLGIMLLAFVGFANAQLLPPVGLQAHVEKNAQVKLEWKKPLFNTTNVVKYYNIYRSSTAASFALLDTALIEKCTDTPPINNSLVWFYYVTAVTQSGESLPSNVAMVNLKVSVDIRGWVAIISKPVVTGTVGVPYTYQVKAVARDSAAVLKYVINRAPSGMAIDTASGLIKWTPTSAGWFAVKVMVTASTGGKADQEYFIRVSSGRPKAIVKGNVTDSTGKGIGHVVISLYAVNHPYFVYSSMTDSTGFYSISPVEEGKYLARAVPLNGGYHAQWYKDAHDQRHAIQIPVPDSGSVDVNFDLKAIFRPPLYAVSGIVTDTSGLPIRGASIHFVRSKSAFSGHMSGDSDDNEWGNSDNDDSMDDEDIQSLMNHVGDWNMGNLDDGNTDHSSISADLDGDFSFEQESDCVRGIHVDSLGRFSIKVEAGSYIAFADARGYLKQFFNHKANLLEADLIVLSRDTTGINFSLSPIPPATGEIRGQVLDSSGVGVRARMIAFLDKWRNVRSSNRNDGVPVVTTETDSTGAYVFKNLPNGDYIILAVPAGPYVPTFYSTSGPAYRWKDASVVTVNGNAVTGIDIYLKRLVNSQTGFTSIKGSTVSGASKVEGAIVFAFLNGELAGYGITNGQGAYTISGLTPARYSVTADKLGYEPPVAVAASPGYNSDGTPAAATTNLIMQKSVIMTVGNPETAPASYALAQNYPNPFNPTTQLAFSLPKNDIVEISIYNILGQKIVTLVGGPLAAGEHQITWDAKDARGLSVPTGIYIYQLKASDYIATRKMMLIR
jgi:hypothetical protein